MLLSPESYKTYIKLSNKSSPPFLDYKAYRSDFEAKYFTTFFNKHKNESWYFYIIYINLFIGLKKCILYRI